MKQASHRLIIGSFFFCMDQSKDLALPVGLSKICWHNVESYR